MGFLVKSCNLSCTREDLGYVFSVCFRHICTSISLTVLVVCIFLGICSFHYVIQLACIQVLIYFSPFCEISSDSPYFIPDHGNSNLLLTLAKALSILSYFTKNLSFLLYWFSLLFFYSLLFILTLIFNFQRCSLFRFNLILFEEKNSWIEAWGFFFKFI